MQFSYKIKIICRVFIIANIQLYTIAFAQVKPVKKLKIYWQEVQADSMQQMTEIKTSISNIIYDLRYATENNFTHTKLYAAGKQTFLRSSVVKALQKVQADLNERSWSENI